MAQDNQVLGAAATGDDVFSSPVVLTTVSPAESYRKKPDGTADQGRKED